MDGYHNDHDTRTHDTQPHDTRTHDTGNVLYDWLCAAAWTAAAILTWRM